MRRAVFLHIPKTGGTSVRAHLSTILPEYSISPSFDARPLDTARAERLKASQVVSGHISWDDTRRFFADREVFTFLRDPIERCLSWHRFARSLGRPPQSAPRTSSFSNDPSQAIALAHELEPVEFFACGHPHIDQNVRNRMVHQLSGTTIWSHRAPETRGLVDAAMSHLESMALVGFLDRLAMDLARLDRLFGCDRPIQSLPHENATDTRARLEPSGEVVAILRRMNLLDLELVSEARRRFAIDDV